MMNFLWGVVAAFYFMFMVALIYSVIEKYIEEKVGEVQHVPEPNRITLAQTYEFKELSRRIALAAENAERAMSLLAGHASKVADLERHAKGVDEYIAIEHTMEIDRNVQSRLIGIHKSIDELKLTKDNHAASIRELGNRTTELLNTRLECAQRSALNDVFLELRALEKQIGLAPVAMKEKIAFRKVEKE